MRRTVMLFDSALSRGRSALNSIVSQHLEDGAVLRSTRSLLIRSPHIKLDRLDRLDERLAAHLDGLLIAGDEGARMAQAELERPSVGALFVAAVIALEHRDTNTIDKLLALAEPVPETRRALASAFGWVSAPSLRGITAPLLSSPQSAQRWLGIAACAVHRVDPGPALAAAIDQPDPTLRARALQAAGELGRRDLLDACLAHLTEPVPTCAHAAVTAAVLLGDRTSALQALQTSALQAGPTQKTALALSLFASDPEAAQALVKKLAAQQAPLRTLIQAAGWAGQAQVLPWLIQHMADERHARVAGEAFSFITGADLALLDLERKPPANPPGGPNDDPEDDNVALDEDENLPWPEPALVQAWWQKNADRFPAGTRIFAGDALSTAHARAVLATHPQRHRWAAAAHLSLLNPGQPMFNCAAPAKRQQRLLAAATTP
jgi:uncharacterized protein (TIGR02270 family)